MKIALLGSAPSSVQFHPHGDPSWRIWACSPGAYPHIKRCDAFFEIHRWEPPNGYTGPKPWFSPEYIAFMAGLKCPVYMSAQVAEIPTCTIYPLERILEKYAPFASYFMQSSLSYMIALAIDAGATEIGLWGVDMAAAEEWQYQRQSCHFWLCLAQHMGIKVTLPPESDLSRPVPLYGFCENDHQNIKLLTRQNELQTRITAIDQELQAKSNERMFLLGALQDNTYNQQTWVHHPAAIHYGLDWVPGGSLPQADVPPTQEPAADPFRAAAADPTIDALAAAAHEEAAANGHIPAPAE